MLANISLIPQKWLIEILSILYHIVCMVTVTAGESRRFLFTLSGVGTPSSLNIINEIGETVVSGIPSTFVTESGLYYADYNFNEDFYPRLYYADWKPRQYFLSGLEEIFVFREDSFLMNHVFGRKGRKLTIPEPFSIMYHCVDSGVIPEYTQVDYWVFDNYSKPEGIYDLVKSYNPNAKVGISIPARHDPRYSSVNGMLTNSEDWKAFFDDQIFNNNNFDFYLISGVDTNEFLDWSFKKDNVFIWGSSPNLRYRNLVYFENNLKKASQIIASGVYLFTNQKPIAGRLGCGYVGITEDPGDLVYRSFGTTKYSSGALFYSSVPNPVGFNSMLHDDRPYDLISTLTVSGYAGTSDYWKTSLETAAMSSFDNIKFEALSFNPSMNIGAELYHTSWQDQEALWEAEYTSGLDTYGASIYPIMSGVSSSDSDSYFQMWQYTLSNLNLDFYIIPETVNSSQISWIRDNFSYTKQVIFKGNTSQSNHIWVSGLDLSQTQALLNAGKYVWTDDLNIAAYLEIGFHKYGVEL